MRVFGLLLLLLVVSGCFGGSDEVPVQDYEDALKEYNQDIPKEVIETTMVTTSSTTTSSTLTTTTTIEVLDYEDALKEFNESNTRDENETIKTENGTIEKENETVQSTSTSTTHTTLPTTTIWLPSTTIWGLPQTTTSTIPCLDFCTEVRIPSPRNCAKACCINTGEKCVYKSGSGGMRCRCN